MIIVYGIPNCDTVAKTRRWLDEQGIEFSFHNFKKDGLDAATVKPWLEALGADILINRRGATWRKLTDAQKNMSGNAEAIALMVENPSIIKRPVIDRGGRYTVGFTDDVRDTLAPSHCL